MINLNKNNWLAFRLDDLFKKEKIKKYNITPFFKGDVPFISSKSEYNGIRKFVSSKNMKICRAGSLTISTNGKCFDTFYHNYEIIPSSDIEVLYPNIEKYGNFLNENVAIFLITILNKESFKYNFGKKPKNNAVWDTEIFLPVDNDKKPAWNVMWNYIELLKKNNNLDKNYSLPAINKKIKLKLHEWKKILLSDVFFINEFISDKYDARHQNYWDNNDLLFVLKTKDKFYTLKFKNNFVPSKKIVSFFLLLFSDIKFINIFKVSIFLPFKNEKINFDYISDAYNNSYDHVLWKEFKLSNFNLISTKTSINKNEINFLGNDNTLDYKNFFNYITRTDKNNGIRCKVYRQDKLELNEGNCITIGLDTQTCFYQEESFYTGQNIHILRVPGFTKFTYMFLVTILKIQIKKLFSWGGNGATLGRLKDMSIPLPIKISGELNIDYMNDFTKSLSYSKYL